MTLSEFATLMQTAANDRVATRLTTRQLALLAVLAADETRIIGCKELATRLRVHKPSITRACGLLAKRGLITNERRKDNVKRNSIRLTEAGRALVATVAAPAPGLAAAA